jgi:hypothetical protein
VPGGNRRRKPPDDQWFPKSTEFAKVVLVDVAANRARDELVVLKR